MGGSRIGFRKKLGLDLFSKLYKQQIEEHPLKTLFWECTLRCNLDCRHCGSDCTSDPGYKDMPIDDFLKTLDSITPHVDPHKVLIVFSGGEVLVRKDLERAGIEVYKREYPWGMVTNGMLLDGERFDSLLKAGLHTISLSLDGFEQDHLYIRRHPKSYQNAIRAMKLISNEPSIAYDIVTCVTGESVGRLPEFRDFLISEGVKTWRIFTIFPVGRGAEDPKLKITDEQFRWLMEFIEQTRKEGKIEVDYACEGFLGGYEAEVRDNFYHCSAGVSTASIRVDGAISGCTSIRGGFDQGNIYKDDFMDVWNNRFEKFRCRDWARKDECAECKVFRWCLGGGMHLRDDNENLLLCHYDRLRQRG